MLLNKQVIYHIKRYNMTNVYISAYEQMDIYDNLNTTEGRLYTLLKSSVLSNCTPEYFTSANLAKELNVSVSTLDNTKSSLKKKGYALIIKFKDESLRNMVRVVVGKEQVTLYNLGVMVEITNAKAYNKLLKKFPITDSNLNDADREILVEQLNKHYLENISEYK